MSYKQGIHKRWAVVN